MLPGFYRKGSTVLVDVVKPGAVWRPPRTRVFQLEADTSLPPLISPMDVALMPTPVLS